ncbi:MAG: HEAT repeat domain-containing protein [Chloroflexota bacterium]|nr:MAG: HEAT repeat domain-containing protein [Chloroflexota bacterium]
MTARRARKGRITAGELLAELEQDPAYIARQAEREIRQQEARREYALAAAPVLAELAETGFPVETIGELYGTPLYYEPVIPILLRWLPRMENLRVKSDIVRALSVKWAKPIAAPVLIQEYRRVPTFPASDMRWTVGNALSVVADDSVFNEIVELVRDRQHGKAREMVALALANMKNPRAVDVLIELLDDEEVAGHALMALRKLAPPRARSYIERFVNHPTTWIRNEAKRALAKIDKKTAKET